jgi:hypothetical protein
MSQWDRIRSIFSENDVNGLRALGLPAVLGVPGLLDRARAGVTAVTNGVRDHRSGCRDDPTRRARAIMDQSDTGRIAALLDDFNAVALPQ